MKLADIKNKIKVKVVDIQDSIIIKKRLYELGLDKGSVFEVAKNNFGTVIVIIGDTKFLIGEGLSKNIEVELC
jgi:Fe2+ transport system protein FeoA